MGWCLSQIILLAWPNTDIYTNKCFICMNLFNPHNNSKSQKLLFVPFTDKKTEAGDFR